MFGLSNKKEALILNFFVFLVSFIGIYLLFELAGVCQPNDMTYMFKKMQRK